METDAACRQCGFALESADRAFGMPPALERPVADVEGVLGALERRRVLRAVSRLERRFPQVSVAVVLARTPAEAPLATYAFWLFNRGQLSSAVEKGGENRLVLLLVDPHTGRSAAMTGYGLEPVFSESRLQACLQAAQPALQRRRFGGGVVDFLGELESHLRATWLLLPKIFGLTAEERWFDASMPGGQAGSHQDSLF